MPVKQINTVGAIKFLFPKPCESFHYRFHYAMVQRRYETNSISRIMKNAAADIYNIDLAITK